MTIQNWNGTRAEEVLLLNSDSDGAGIRFGLNHKISSSLGQSIRYESQVDKIGNIAIQISCKVDKLGDPTFLAAIEAENYGAMNLKREFIFPRFINRSYSALRISTVNDLSFAIKLPGVFRTRFGGAAGCVSGNNLEVEEYAVPFEGDVSKRLFDTEWTSFRRENSNIRIHFELTRVKTNGDETYANTEHTFVCKFITAIVVRPAIWYTVWKNGSVIEEFVDYDWAGELQDTSYFTKNIPEDVVAVNCSASFYYGYFWRHISLPLEMIGGNKPSIDIEHSKNENVLRAGAINQVLTCTVDGRPPPNITWLKDGVVLPGIKTSEGNLLYQIPKVEPKHAGNYICSARNIYGEDEMEFRLDVSGDPTTNYAITIILPVVVCCVTVIGAYVYIKYFKQEKVGLTRAEIQEFLVGQAANLSESLYAHEFAHLNAYDRNYEINPGKFQVDDTSILGSGAFGIVLKRIVDGRPVAVKTTKRHSDKAYLKALLSELKIMIYLGYHENIISVIGASTKNLHKGSLYIFVRYCPYGNLENYLRNNRDNFLESTPYVTINKCGQVITLLNLLKWGVQIASGMAYLGSKRVIHGDLASRNILLDEKMQARITDFGLSRQLYDYESYVKKHQEPLPWRWMALEALSDLVFSTQSDVWSYGITLWEIFSLGEVPYPGMSWNLEFVQQLKNGLRMGKPIHSSLTIYSRVLVECWSKQPSERISFQEIVENLSEEIEKFEVEDSSKQLNMGNIGNTDSNGYDHSSNTNATTHTPIQISS